MTLADGHYLDDLRSLRDRELQLRAAFDSAVSAMVITDGDGAWLDMNEAAVELLGRDRAQIRGRHLEEFVPPGPRSGTEAGSETARIAQLVRDDGSERVVEICHRANILPGRHLEILREIAAPTTDRPADPDALLAVAEAAADALIGTDLGGRITAWNDAAGDLYALPRESALGSDVNRLVAAEQRPGVEELLAVVGRGGAVVGERMVHRTADGEDMQVAVSVAPIRATQGHVTGAALVVRDERDPRGAETILLLEVDAELRELARATLERRGYTVLVAVDPGEALAFGLDQGGAIDLVITNLDLPGMTGRQLARQLAAIGCTDLVLYLDAAATEPTATLAGRVRRLLDRAPA